MDRLEGLALDLRLRRTLGVCRRRGGEGVVRGVVARRVVGRRRSVHGRIRTIGRKGSRSRSRTLSSNAGRSRQARTGAGSAGS
jgi:hypothetical protein